MLTPKFDGSPDARFEIQRILVDGDLAMVHVSASGPGRPDAAVADIYRFENGRIVEHWDVLQPVPGTPPTTIRCSRPPLTGDIHVPARTQHRTLFTEAGDYHDRVRAAAAAGFTAVEMWGPTGVDAPRRQGHPRAQGRARGDRQSSSPPSWRSRARSS